MEEREKLLMSSLMAGEDFIIIGDPTDFIKKWADSESVEVLSLELQSIEDIQGERVVVTDVPTPYFDYKIWWMDVVEEHPDKNYLMLFYVENADISTINALKSYIEDKPENLFYGVICRDTNKRINSTINSICFPIKW